MQLILHVGLPKTATTTIQFVMDTAKAELAVLGVLYPGTTRTQIRLVHHSQFKQREGAAAADSLAEAMTQVAEEVRAVRPQQIVLSCERMILVSPGAVARMQRAIAHWLPEVEAVRVLAYLRDPVSWATSLCQQRLKMGTARLADFAADPWPLRLEPMLKIYADRYGRKAVELRLLRPELLLNGNVVDDFLAAIGLEGFTSPVAAPMLNRSLTLHGVQVADVLADLVPRGRRQGVRKRLFRQLLQAIEGPRFVLPQEVQERIIAASKSDVEYVRQHWGLTLRAEPIAQPDAPALDGDAVLALALELVETVERAVIEDEGPEEDDGS